MRSFGTNNPLLSFEARNNPTNIYFYILNRHMKSDKKKEVATGPAATPRQKEKFEKEKAKQIDKDEPQFDPDSDEDTTGKSEVLREKKVRKN